MIWKLWIMQCLWHYMYNTLVPVLDLKDSVVWIHLWFVLLFNCQQLLWASDPQIFANNFVFPLNICAIPSKTRKLKNIARNFNCNHFTVSRSIPFPNMEIYRNLSFFYLLRLRDGDEMRKLIMPRKEIESF